jgi:hypothetical protein
LDFRSSCGEKLDNESYLIREQFDINDFEQIRKKSRKVAYNTLKQNLQLLLIKSGLRKKNLHYKHGDRTEIPMSHGFRKFWTTQVIHAKINPEIREMLLGHGIGLAGAYYRPTESDMIEEFIKCINDLTINEENRLRKEVETLKVEKSLIDQMKIELESIKERINNQSK